MPEPLSSFPSELRQGDTLKVQVSLDEYPASDGWVLTWYFSGKETEFEKAADADHLLTLTPEETGAFAVGALGYVAKATLGGDVYTALSGSTNVLPDLATSGPIDTRSYNQRMVDALRAMLEGRASSDEQEYTIKDRSLKRMNLQELMDMLALFEQKLAAENGTLGRNIKTIFRRP